MAYAALKAAVSVISEALSFGIEVAADKKISLAEIFSSVGVARDVVGIDFAEAAMALKSLTPEQKAELTAIVKQKTALTDKALEGKVELIAEMALDAILFANRMYQGYEQLVVVPA